MATGVGMGFDVSQLTKAMDKLDKQLEAVLAKSDKVQKSFKSLFDSKNPNWDVLTKIDKLKSSLVDISKVKDPLKWDTKGVSNYIDQVNRLLRTINVMNGAAGYQFFDTKDLEKAKTEFKKLLTEVKGYEKQSAARTTSRNQTYSGALKYSDNVKTLEQEKKAVQNLEHAREKLKKTDADYENKLRTLNNAIERHNENIKNATLSTRQLNSQRANTTQGALGAYNQLYSPQGVRSLNQMKTVLKQLETAQANINRATKEGQRDWKQVGGAIRRVKRDIESTEKEMGKFHNQQRGILDTSGQLARAMAAVFSVSAIKGYVNKLMQIRGEFELQQRSLQVLLQNKDEANELWDKTVALAVKSPLTTKQLVTSTKQLAAYRIENEKLYETNKMLADVSQGLGVDMNRLILAFGQVKAANFLRGTELRQFSEAGVNLLEELSKRFTALEGRAVSVGDVFERVSKRMVTFSDVEAVFQKITSEGGIFYKMQEQQAETLKGMRLNIQDSFELMLNDIGKNNEGLLKGFLSVMKAIVDNWKIVAEVVKIAGAAVLLFKLNTALASDKMQLLAIDMGVLTDANQKQLKFTQLLTMGWKKAKKAVVDFGKALIANPWTAILTVALYVLTKFIGAWSDHKKQLEEIEKKYNDIRDSVSSLTFKFETKTDISELKSSLQSLVDVANNELHMNVEIDVSKLNEEQVREKFASLRSEILYTETFVQDTLKAFENATWDLSLGDDIRTDFKDLTKSSNEFFSSMTSNSHKIVSALKEVGKYDDEYKKLLEPIREGESDLEYLERLKEGFAKFQKEVMSTYQTGNDIDHTFGRGFFGLYKDWSEQYETYTTDLKEAEKEFSKFKKNINIDENLTDEQKVVRFSALIDAAKAQEGWNEFVESHIKKWVEEEYEITFTPAVAKTNKLDKWAEDVTEAVDSLNKKLKQTYTEEQLKDIQLFPLPNVGQTKDAYLNLAKDVIAIIDATYNEGQKIVDEATVRRTNILKSEGDEYKKIVNLYKTPKVSKDANKIFDDRLKVIKEIYKAYKDLNKTFDDITAKEGAMAKFGAAFKEAFGKTPKQMGFDLFSEEGVKKAYDYLIKKAPSAAKRVKAELEKGEIVWDAKIRLQEESHKNFIEQLEGIFRDYEFTIEMEKLNIPPDLASKLFGFDAIDISGLRKTVLDSFTLTKKEGKKTIEKKLGDMIDFSDTGILETLKQEGYSEQAIEDVRKALKRVEELENKSQLELLKNYVTYLRKAQRERVKIQLDGIKQVAEVEKSFVLSKKVATEQMDFTDDQWNAYRRQVDEGKVITKDFLKSLEYGNTKNRVFTDEQIDKIIEYNELLREQQAIIKNRIELDAKRKLAEADWNEFVKSPEIEAAFNSIDKLSNTALDALLEQFKEMHETLKEAGADATVLSNVLDEISKIEQKKLERNPFSGFKDVIEYEENRTFFEDVLEKLQKARQDLKTAENALALYKETDDIKKYNAQLLVVRDAEDGVKRMAEAFMYAWLKFKKSKNAFSDLVKTYNTLKESITSVADAMLDMLSKLGVLSDEDSAIFDGVQSAISNVLEVGENIVKLAANPADIGAWAGAITSLISLIGDVAEVNDARIDKQIQKELKSVELLQKKYEELEEAIDRAYSVDRINEYYNASLDNIDQQIASTQRMIASENDKKKSDQDAIDGWYDEIDELLAKRDEAEKEYLQKLGGVGGEANYGDIVSGFVDAWLDGFMEVGDGIDALDEHFDDFIKNLVSKQLAARVVSSSLQGILAHIDKSIAKDGIFDKDEWTELLRQKEEVLPQLNEALSKLLEEFGATEWAGKQGELGSLSAGIQGMSAEQADILAAYWSSSRFLLSTIDNNVRTITENLGINAEVENPMLPHLRAISEQTRAIRDMFESVIGRGGNNKHGGAYLKVDIG